MLRRQNFCTQFFGGPQESGMRPGTENLPGIVGIGKAAELRSKRFDTVTNRVQELRDIFELSVLRLVPNVEVNGDRTRRVHNSNKRRIYCSEI